MEIVTFAEIAEYSIHVCHKRNICWTGSLFSGYLSRALSFAFGEISNVCLKVICECYLDLHLSSDVRAHAHKPPNNDIKRSKRS